MQGKMRFEFLGLNEFQGKKDPTKTYYTANLLQGSEVVKVFLQEGQEVLFTGIHKMDEIECDLEINIGAKTYVSLKSVIQIENGKPVGNKASA
jgi:hypothetical protein